MPIIYALVARATSQSCCVLAEHTTTSGNFTTVTRRILEKVPEKSGSYSYIYDKVYLFHIIRADGLLYVCLADEGFGKRIPFAFLEDIKSSFVATYGDSGREALAYAMNENFGPVLQRQIEYYSTNPGADKIGKIKGEIDEVKHVMVQNIDRVLERGEKIELLVDKTDALNQQAFKFKKHSTSLRKKMWWKNFKLQLIIASIIIVIILIIVFSVCGITFQNCGNSGGGGKKS